MSANPGALDRLKGQARLLVLLRAVETAGFAPVGLMPLHALAYLANVLAPVWDMPVLDGKILKSKGGPFYPTLQGNLDRMVGLGMVTVSDVSYLEAPDGSWQLSGAYQLNRPLAEPAIGHLQRFPDERAFAEFADELALALSTLTDEEMATALVHDATYGDPRISTDNVVDFDEWSHSNPSVNAASYFDRIMADRIATPGEKVHLYVRHLHRRLHAANG